MGAAVGLAALSAAVVAPAQEPDPDDPRVLVWFDFDGDAVETGPWTVTAYEDASGSVALSSRYRFSGHRSVEIRDVAGDGEFAELQGFFRELDSGTLYVHFALLLADPEQPANVALAGESHFQLVRDGIGFWLKVRDGAFVHVTRGVDRPLARARAFVWYTVDLAYHVEPGSYDLELRVEGDDAPVVTLREQPNAVGIPGSRLHKFSFIGDTPGRDASDATLYVDDLLIAADRPVPAPGPFVAPGRRMLFVDLYRHYRERLHERPGCPPALGPGDFAVAPRELGELKAAGLLEAFDALADHRGTAVPGTGVPPRLAARLEAMALWSRGCGAPHRCEGASCAEALFEAAERLAPEARLYPMSRVMALAAGGRWPEADALLVSIYPEWERDPRFPALAAALGIARGDLDDAEAWLRAGADHLPPGRASVALRRLWSGRLDQALLRDLQSALPLDWPAVVATALSAEHRFYVALWQHGPEAARAWATRMIARLEELEIDPGRWLERRGDALFELGDTVAALRSYEASLATLADPVPVYAKLSDVYFTLGDLEREREYRERVHGSLLH